MLLWAVYAFRISFVAWQPSIIGMFTSITITSGKKMRPEGEDEEEADDELGGNGTGDFAVMGSAAVAGKAGPAGRLRAGSRAVPATLADEAVSGEES